MSLDECSLAYDECWSIVFAAIDQDLTLTSLAIDGLSLEYGHMLADKGEVVQQHFLGAEAVREALRKFKLRPEYVGDGGDEQ